MFVPNETHKINSNDQVVEVLEKTIEWLNNLERECGSRILVDKMPNGFSGRYSLQAAITYLAGEVK